MRSSPLPAIDHGLPISGLMCIPPADEAPAPHFALTAQIARRNGLSLLSMGMSADFARRHRLRRNPCAGRHGDFRGARTRRLVMNHNSGFAGERGNDTRKSRFVKATQPAVGAKCGRAR